MRSVTLSIATAFMVFAGATSAADGPFVMAKSTSTVIDCAATPFGDVAPLSVNREPVVMMGGNTLGIDEYRAAISPEPGPLTRMLRNDMAQPLLDARPFQSATAVDLNGDGRDEVVVAFSDDNGFVELGVFQRNATPAAILVDVWKFAGNNVADRIDIVAGDFDGSKDGVQELAVAWPITTAGPDQGKTRIVFLTGDANGHIAQADDQTAGRWVAGQASNFTSLAAGDFLLDGRDQAALTSVLTVAPFALGVVVELVELETPNTAVLQPTPGSVNVGSAIFSSPFHTNFLGHSIFHEDYPTGEESFRRVAGMYAIEADGGDIVDTAADELVVHLLFNNAKDVGGNDESFPVLGQRLIHFDVARAAGGAMTAITIGNAGGGIPGSDSNRIVRYYNRFASWPFGAPQPPAIDATIANVDGAGKEEILLVQAGREPASVDLVGDLVWWAQVADVRLQAAFQYRNRGQRVVEFTNQSLGNVTSVLWNFGDGQTSSELNPLHAYGSTGTRTVTLTATDASGASIQKSLVINVVDGANAGLQGPPPPNYVYRIVPEALYRGITTAGGAMFAQNSLPTIDAGNIEEENGDPHNEVVVASYAANGQLVRSVFRRPLNPPLPPYDYALEEEREPIAGLTDLKLVLADFNGDSARAALGTDCRNVTDQQVRSLVWHPPYFAALQDGATKEAHFGRDYSQANSTERQTGSYTSHDVSGFVGIEVGFALGPAEVESTLVFTAGKNWQAARGKLHGNENEYSVSQGFSQGAGEALVTAESNNADCYSYQVIHAGAPVDPTRAALRMCEVKNTLQSTAGTDAVNWNALNDVVAPVEVPLHWVPMQRDWASLALFRAVGGTPAAAAERNKATDGLFTTSANAPTSAAPYLEVDLGEVRDVSAVRVFPTPNTSSPNGLAALAFDAFDVDLWGFRLYASETPFAGAGVPAGAGVRTFLQPHNGTTAAPTNEAVSGPWSIWTNDPNTRAPLRARYLRLQHPGNASIKVSEIQVFGEMHAEPQSFPDDVCDPLVGDGLFKAKVWDAAGATFRTIDVRGDMMWTGTVPSGASSTGVAGCSNDLVADMPTNLQPNRSVKYVAQRPIWEGTAIGGSADPYWELGETTTITEGSYSSLDSSTRVGVAFDFTAGFGVKATGGAAYEFTTGITEDVQTSIGWGDGLGVGGSIGGFVQPSPGVVSQCQYYPRPYAFQLTDHSSVGFRHDVYVTDYVVKHAERGSGAWQRQSVPAACATLADGVFSDGFE